MLPGPGRLWTTNISSMPPNVAMAKRVNAKLIERVKSQRGAPVAVPETIVIGDFIVVGDFIGQRQSAREMPP